MPDPGTLPELAEYLERGMAAPPPPPISGGSALRRLPAWTAPLLRQVGTKALHSRSRKKFEELASSGPVRLHLGCGWARKDGWVNVDLFATSADIAWDLRHGIPLPDGTVEAIFHEHMLEHLSLRDGFLFTKACHRALKPGGVLRIAVPDAGLCIDSYAGKADADWARSRPTGLLAVQALFYEHGHQAMYDAETLTKMCLAADFDEARQTEFGKSWIEPCPDSLDRREGTLYVEARRQT
jgi:predicted SAM-dependent methyltransferase